MVERRSTEADGFPVADLLAVEGANETLLAVPETIGRLFSLPSLASVCLVSSTDVTDCLDL